MKKIIYIALVALLSSCVVKPFESKSAKELELDALYQTVCDTTQNVAQTPWQEVFTVQELQDIIDSVLLNNFDYQVAVLRVDQSYSMLRSARAQIAPTLNFSADYAGTKNLSESGSAYSDNLSASLNLNWEIDLWGRLYASKEAQKANFWATEEAANAARQSLIAATAQAYFEIAALEAKERIIQEAIENRREYLQTTRDFKESGKVNEVAVQQAIAQLAEVQAALPNCQLAIVTAKNALALLAGKTTLEESINFDIHQEAVVLDIAGGTPVQLLSFRPDVRAAEMQYRSSHYLSMAARAALYPSLNIGIGASVTGITTSHSIIMNTLAGLVQPIFNGRALRSNLEQAKTEAKISEIEFQQSLFTAVMEVNNALHSVHNCDSIVKYQNVQLDALRKAYDYSGELFVNDYTSYLELLVAQTSVYDAELSVVDSYLNCIDARIELYRALGGGALQSNTIAEEIVRKKDPILKDKQ